MTDEDSQQLTDQPQKLTFFAFLPELVFKQFPDLMLNTTWQTTIRDSKRN